MNVQTGSLAHEASQARHPPKPVMSVAPSGLAGSQMMPASDSHRPVAGRGITGVNRSQCAHGGVALGTHASSRTLARLDVLHAG